jgi:hypothetical protein
VEAGAPGTPRRLVVKVPRLVPGKAERRRLQLEREVTAARSLVSTLEGHDDLSVPEPVAFYPDLPAVVWAEVGGETLDAMARRLARGIPSAARLERLEMACRGAGRWLRALQDATPVSDRELSLNEMLDYVDVRLKRIGELGATGLGADWRAGVRRVFHRTKLAPADLRLAAVHGDFSLSNIMYDGSRVVAIDLARFGVGSISYDVTRLYHQLGLLQLTPYVLASTVARLRQAFLSGYDPRLHVGHPLFQLFLIQHLLCHWLGLLKPSAAPYHVRAFHRWVGYRHRRELDHLVARFPCDVQPGVA